MSRESVIFIVGPTATGKSDLALALAKKFGGLILNCDSLQCYERLNIGTAKPGPLERSEVPHLLFDVRSVGQTLTAGDFRKLALKELSVQIHKGPIFAVGGSGFYIQALEKGMFDISKPNPEVEARVKSEYDEKGISWAHRELCRLDPVYGEKINPNDSYRIQRGLVILYESGRKVSELQNEFKVEPLPYRSMKLGFLPTREELLPRVQRRVQQMLQAGLIEEVRKLLDEDAGGWPPLLSVGYKECRQFLAGELTETQLPEKIVEKTMQLAKRQKSWFKRDLNTQWLGLDDPMRQAEPIVDKFLKGTN